LQHKNQKNSHAVYISGKSSVYRSRAAHHTQQRVNLMSEIIERIVSIKSFCMEQVYAKSVKETRSKEIGMLRGTLYLRAISTSFNLLLKISTFLCLVCALNLDTRLDASNVYIIISYYSMLFTSMLQFWPLLMTHAREVLTTVEKIREILISHDTLSFDKNKKCENLVKLLMMEDVRKAKRVVNESCEIKSVFVRNVVVYGKLKCDYVELKEAKCYGVVGSSSSNFLDLILGEIECDSGEININGRISYASCKPWIFPGCVRENIIFTEQFDAQRYSQVLKICALAKELETLPANDETFIDDVCINESIKTRINLARCVYRNADIYIFDNEILGKNSFRAVIKNFLKVGKFNFLQ
jgi:ATP-binding cassette, subfamily C (CFTR/MRP), member 4